MNSRLLLISLLLSLQVFASDHKYIFDTPQQGLIKFLDYGKNKYIVTANRLYRIGKKALHLQAAFAFNCNDACAYKDGIALATDSGLRSYSFNHGSIEKLMPEKIKRPVNQVLLDMQNRLWFSHPYDGAYLIENGQVQLRVQAPVIYDMAATPDSNVWVGTNLGLYKIPLSGNALFRYAEESKTGLDLPDNIVEQLFADDASNVWALMPEHLAFIQGKNDGGHIPAYSYPAVSNNKVFAIAKLPLSTHSFLFSTIQGLLYTKSLHGVEETHIHSGEIHQTYYETAHAIDDELTERPVEFTHEPVVSIYSDDRLTWFATSKGAWCTKTKRLLKRLQSI